MICRECGANIDDNAIECKFCGAVYGENASEEVSEQVETETVSEEMPVVNDSTEAMFDENDAKRKIQIERIRADKQSKLEEIEKRRRDKKRKQQRIRILIILIAILCAGAIAAGVYYIGTSSGNSGNDVVVVTQRPTNTPNATEEPTEIPTVEPEPESTETVTAAPTVTETATKKPSSATTAAPKKNNTTQSKPTATKKPASANASTAKNKITSALVTGGDVIKANGKTYMSFTYNGAVEYAKVSDNTTTNFVKGKPITLSGYQTDEVYNGKKVYAITSITNYKSGTYIFPSSGSKLLTDADMAGKSAAQLRLGRNEIYARHGRKFNDSSLQSYFESCSWYKVNAGYNYSNDSANLNEIEKKNILFIKSYENALGQ